MTSDLAVRDASAPLALRPGQMIFDDLQQKALAQMGVKNATKADLAVYAHVCHRTMLDPFTRQIYMIERREKVGDQWISKQTIQTGIDGFRVIRDRAAERTNCEAELEDTIWYDADDKPHSEWLWDTPPVACRVVLVKHSNKTGRALRFPAVLRTAAYMAMKNGQPVSQWKSQPDHMIEKCCEAFACRRAFPNDFAGVYLEEEMLRSPEDDNQRPAARKVTAADIMQPSAPADDVPPDDVVDGEFVDEPELSEPAASEEAPKPAGVAALKKLKATLDGLPFREGDDLVVIRWLTGRPEATLDDLSRTECGQVQHQLSSWVDAADSPDEAVSAIWVQFHAANDKPDSEPADVS